MRVKYILNKGSQNTALLCLSVYKIVLNQALLPYEWVLIKIYPKSDFPVTCLSVPGDHIY
jgi:hypothetical protein